MQAEDPRDRRIAELTALVERLFARIAELEAEVARLSRNSTNSSKPPSSDPPGVARPPRQPSGKKRGGQPGHKPHQRRQLPQSKVNVVVPLVPAECCNCGAGLHGDDIDPLRHQVVEIPPISPVVTEYVRHALSCDECGAITRAELPPGVPMGAFGPRLSAMIAVLTAKYRMSKRSVQELLCDFLGVELAVGSVCKVEQNISAALEVPVREAMAHIPKAAVVHADETGWREAKKKAWLWVAATSLVTVFVVARSRGAKVIKDLLGDDFAGVLTTDRWSAYAWVDVSQRQLCWSHLLRDFQGWVDSDGEGARIGEELIQQARRMFHWWHKVRDGTMSRSEFRLKMRPVQIAVGALLSTAEDCRDKRVAGMAKQMLKVEYGLWTFVGLADVEPTNNFAERQIRHAVLWRKSSFGTDSVAGSRFVERMLTTIATLRSQERSVLEFITDAYRARLTASTPPSLLPQQTRLMLAAA